MSILQIVKKTVHTNRPTKVYDFTVENDHHYILSNGVISHNSYVPMKELGGGSGLKYAASTIVTLSKKKDKQDDEVVGNIITCKLYKSRLTKENKIVQVQLNFDSGLNRYYGLVDLALDYGIFKKNSTKIELPDGTKVFEKHINEEPEKYFTQEILKQIDERVQEDFKYG